MPGIHKLQITTFRNITQETLEPASRLNLITGENGSGKSSILEAIHLLGLGRSFRNTRQTPVIQHGARSCSVFAVLDKGVTLGVGRNLDEPSEIRIQGRKAQSSAELAIQLPLQLLNAEAFRLLEGGPKSRRQFLDWGVFHVEHLFHEHWREYQRCLQNRNILLKARAAPGELQPWTHELVRLSGEIDAHRRSYLDQYLPCLEDTLEHLVTLEGLSIRYYRGWAEEKEISETLESTRDRDYSLGHTSAGPHRADLKFRIGQQYARDILSRGQQKLLVSAMKLAQGRLMSSESGRQCLYLIDDLPAELDRVNRQKICRLLQEIGGQVFITGTEKKELLKSVEEAGFPASESKLFHVKHGKISTLNFG